MSDPQRVETRSPPATEGRAVLFARASLPVWIELLVWLSLAAMAYVLTFEFADERGTFRWGPTAWPRAVILLLALGALLQFAVRLRNLQPRAASGSTLTLADRLRVLGVFAIPLVYVWTLPRMGFYVATPLFLIGYLLYLGERRWRLLLGVPLFIYAIVNLVFTRLFYVALPTGNWPGFYDFSHWFITVIR